MKTIFKLFPVVLLLGVLAQLALPFMGMSQTVNGMRAAVNGQPGSFVYAKDGMEYVLLGWSQGSDYGFLFVDKAGKVLKDWTLLFGTRAKWQDAAGFLTYLEKQGWSCIPSGLLPAALVHAVSETAFLFTLAQTGLPTLVFMPAGVLDLKLIPEVNG